MGLSQTILFYLVIGAAVAVAVGLRENRNSRGYTVLQTLLACAFWPMYLPVLLSRTDADDATPVRRTASSQPADDIAVAIAQVEAELESAVGSLDGWAENVLSYEETRFDELRAAWRTQAERIRELDRLLSQPEFAHQPGQATSDDSPSSRTSHSEQARRENIDRLHQVRRRMHDDLMGTLAWVRELVTMIHLAKFTGAPASRAEELVAQIAAAVEGLTEVSSWKEDPVTVA